MTRRPIGSLAIASLVNVALAAAGMGVAGTASAAPGKPMKPRQSATQCDDQAFQVTAPTADGTSTFSRYDIRTNKLERIGELGKMVNAIAYSAEQNTIYGIAKYADGFHTVTVGLDGTLTDKGMAPASARAAYAGAINGKAWYVATGTTVSTIDIDPASGNYLKAGAAVSLSDTSRMIGDFDVNPLDGKLYGVDSNGKAPGKIVSVDPASGAVTTVTAPAGLPKASSYGAVSISPDGIMYATSNDTAGASQVFRVDLLKPDNVTALARSEIYKHNDGAACLAARDYGDAPDSYRTLHASDGPFHDITAAASTKIWLNLGREVRSVLDGTPSDNADADPDDDAFTDPIAINVKKPTVTVPVRNTTGKAATLAAWLDLNGNGTFEAEERVVIPLKATDSCGTVTWPAGTATGTSFMRLRLYEGEVADPKPTGGARGGEVEDHLITLK